MNPKPMALTWAPEGKRRGRPRETCRRTIVKERAQLGCSTWNEAETAAKKKRELEENDRWPHSPPEEKGLIMIMMMMMIFLLTLLKLAA